MNISEVKTAFKIADVEFVENSTKLHFNYLKVITDENGAVLPKDILTKNYSRVYIIVVDGVIKKIGASQICKTLCDSLRNRKQPTQYLEKVLKHY